MSSGPILTATILDWTVPYYVVIVINTPYVQNDIVTRIGQGMFRWFDHVRHEFCRAKYEYLGSIMGRNRS